MTDRHLVPQTIQDASTQLARTLESIKAMLPVASQVTVRQVGSDALPNARMMLHIVTLELMFDPAAYVAAGSGASIAEDVTHKVAMVAWQHELAGAGLNRPLKDDFAARPEFEELQEDENVALQLGGEIIATELSLSSAFEYGLNGGLRNEMADHLSNAVADAFMRWRAWFENADADRVLDALLENYAGIVGHVLRRYTGLRGRFAASAQADMAELAALARDEDFDFLRGLSILEPFAEQIGDE